MVSPPIGSLLRRTFFILAIFVSVAATASAGFTIQDLGVISPSGISGGAAINAFGSVVGSASNILGHTVAASTIGSSQFMPIEMPAQAISSQGNGINNGGEVAGTYIDAKGVSHGFYGSSGGVSTVAALAGGTYTEANGINNQGQVVGTGDIGNGMTRAFYIGSSGGGPTIINPLGSGLSNVGNGINQSGTIVGSSQISPYGIVHAFISNNGGPAVDISQRNSVGNFLYNTYGQAIANNGDVAGYGDVGGFEHAFYASATGGSLVDLGLLPGTSSSKSLGLNDLAQVVGEASFGASSPGQYNSQAFLWDDGHGMVNLNTLISAGDQANWLLAEATGINDSDQITGIGYLDGVEHGFLLTPIDGESIFDPAIAVPEPSTAILASIGLSFAAAWSKFRRGRTEDRAVA